MGSKILELRESTNKNNLTIKKENNSLSIPFHTKQMESTSSSGTWERPTPGDYPARISRIVSIGKQHGDYLGKATLNQKLLIPFQLSGPLKSNGKPFEISAVVTKSNHENSHLVRIIDACLGHHDIDDLSKILDKPIWVSVIAAVSKTTGTEKSYVAMNSIRSLPVGLTAEPLDTEPVVLSFPKSKAEFDALTPYERIKVEASPDWKTATRREDDFVKRTLAKEKAKSYCEDDELAGFQRLLNG